MKRPILSPEAKEDLANIRAYLKREASQEVANGVIKKIRAAIAFLGRNPGAGHLREDLTDLPLKFWTVGA